NAQHELNDVLCELEDPAPQTAPKRRSCCTSKEPRLAWLLQCRRSGAVEKPVMHSDHQRDAERDHCRLLGFRIRLQLHGTHITTLGSARTKNRFFAETACQQCVFLLLRFAT